MAVWTLVHHFVFKSRSFCPSQTNEKRSSSVDGIQLLLYVWQSAHAVTRICTNYHTIKMVWNISGLSLKNMITINQFLRDPAHCTVLFSPHVIFAPLHLQNGFVPSWNHLCAARNRYFFSNEHNYLKIVLNSTTRVKGAKNKRIQYALEIL